MAHEVCISYDHDEQAMADQVCAVLETQYHLRCWIAPRDTRPGSDWVVGIGTAIARSRVVVLPLSAVAGRSDYMRRSKQRTARAEANTGLSRWGRQWHGDWQESFTLMAARSAGKGYGSGQNVSSNTCSAVHGHASGTDASSTPSASAVCSRAMA
jgi:TIR domain